MIWVGVVLSELFFGFQLSNFLLSKKLSCYEIMPISIPIGFGISSILFFFCSLNLSFSSFHLILHSCGLTLVGTMIHIKKNKFIVKFSKPFKRDLIFNIVSLIVAFFISWNAYFPKIGVMNIAYASDLPEEIGIMNSFYHGVNSGFVNIFKIRNPICYKCRSYTRWLTALHSAMLKVGFSSDRIALTIPSLLMIYSICSLMMYLSNVFIKGWLIPILTMFLFLFLGGFGMVNWLNSKERHNMNLDFVFDFGSKQTQWSSPILHYILGLRPSQMSLCLILSLLFVLSKHDIEYNEFIFLGIILGILPAVQHQVFICAIIYIISYFLIKSLYFQEKNLLEKQKQFITLIISFSIVGVIPLIQYIPSSNRLFPIHKASFSKRVMLEGSYFPFIRTWFDSLGFFPLITLSIGLFFIQKDLLLLYIPSLIIFLISNNFIFQGYSRQNIIIFYPFWITIASIVYMKTFVSITKLTKNEEIKGIIIGFLILLYISSIGSSILGYYRLRNSTKYVFTEEQYQIAKKISSLTPKKSVFISSNENYDVISTLTGKQSYLQNSYLTYINDFKIDQREQEITSLLSHSSTTTILPKVKYILNQNDISPSRQLLNYSEEYWNVTYQNPTKSVTLFSRKT